jgi:hypothetical protein
MNRLVTYIILAAAVIVSGVAAFFIIQRHNRLVEED